MQRNDRKRHWLVFKSLQYRLQSIYRYCTAFYECLTVPVARGGSEKQVPAYDGVPDMIRQIYVEYHLPIPPYDMTVREILFWYKPLIPELTQTQKEIKKKRNGKPL